MIAPKQTGTPAKKGGKKSARPLLYAGMAVAAAAVATWLVVTGGRKDGATDKRPPKVKVAVAETRPAKAAPRDAKPEAKDYSKLDNIQLRRLPESETNNLTEAQVNYWKMFHPWPPPDENQPKAIKGKYQIFESKADNEIAFVLSVEPGTMVLGNRSVGPDFERRFLKSIERPIIISKDDSDYEKELKRAVIDAKIELKAAYDRGEDIGKIMDDAREELQRMARYKAQMEKEAMKILVRKDATAADAEDVIKAMNMMLEQKGIGPIELNSMSRLAIKYQNLIKKETEE